MDHRSENKFYLPNRLGFHYFPDAQHFSESHINQWLPVLETMRVGWLVLQSPITFAIPEDFIRALSSKKIKIIVDFLHPLDNDMNWDNLEVLIRAYGRWGVDYAILDRKANMRNSWGSSHWGNPLLISNYVNRFLRFSDLTLENAIRPVLGPLVPGGNYWDFAFLHTFLARLSESASDTLKTNLVLSAFAWHQNRDLDWGVGGPQAWPQSNPQRKITEPNEHQQGFRAYEWVNTAANHIFGQSLPLILLEAGIPYDPSSEISLQGETDLEKILAMNSLLKGRNAFSGVEKSKLLSPIPAYVIALHFHVLSASQEALLPGQWFEENGSRRLSAQAFYTREGLLEATPEIVAQPLSSHHIPELNFKYPRYVLITDPLRSMAADLIECLQPFIAANSPELGFSIEEASQAAIVNVIAPDGFLDENLMRNLKAGGGLVKVIRPEEIIYMQLENDL